jgi:hypothetical protein
MAEASPAEIEVQDADKGEGEVKKARSTASILSGKNTDRGPRVDAKGNPIEKGGKQHGLVFRDQAQGGSVQDVKEVTAYKHPFGTNYTDEQEKIACCSLM